MRNSSRKRKEKSKHRDRKSSDSDSSDSESDTGKRARHTSKDSKAAKKKKHKEWDRSVERVLERRNPGPVLWSPGSWKDSVVRIWPPTLFSPMGDGVPLCHRQVWKLGIKSICLNELFPYHSWALCKWPLQLSHSFTHLHSAGGRITLSSCHCQSQIPVQESRLEPQELLWGESGCSWTEWLAPTYCPTYAGLIGGWSVWHPAHGQRETGSMRENTVRSGAHFLHPPTWFCCVRSDSQWS